MLKWLSWRGCLRVVCFQLWTAGTMKTTPICLHNLVSWTLPWTTHTRKEIWPGWNVLWKIWVQKRYAFLGTKLHIILSAESYVFLSTKTTYILRYKIYTYSLVQSLEGFLFSLYWKTHRGLRTHSSTTGQTYTLTEIIMTNVLSHTYSQCHGDNNT